jgi:hypothetical protein
MVILAVLILLLTILLASTWSSARSYFAKGRLKGMEEATLEIIRGVNSHYQSAGQGPPEHVTKAIDAVRSFARGASHEKSIYRYQARLWIFGDAVGAACWRKGYDVCKLQMTPGDDKIRVELSMNELLHLTWLAHLGFRKMMPNDRGIEMHRFGDEDDAREGTRAIERLELAIPAKHRPFDDPLAQSASRLELIENWWPLQRKTA